MINILITITLTYCMLNSTLDTDKNFLTKGLTYHCLLNNNWVSLATGDESIPYNWPQETEQQCSTNKPWCKPPEALPTKLLPQGWHQGACCGSLKELTWIFSFPILKGNKFIGKVKSYLSKSTFDLKPWTFPFWAEIEAET